METKKLHILFLCSWYPHLNNQTEGIFIKRHAECVALTHDVTVIYAKSSDEVWEESISTVTTGNLTEIIVLYPKVKSKVPLLSAYIKFKTYVGCMMKAAEIARQKRNIDLLHLNVIFPACIPALQLLKSLKRPLLITEHWTGYSPEDGSYRGFLMKYFTRNAVKKAHTILTVSDYLKNMMNRHQLYGNYKTVPNVVDTELFQPGEAKPGAETHFIHISSLDNAQKNVPGILRAFAEALKLNGALKLTIVGGPAHISELVQLSRQLHIEKQVHFAGRLMGAALVKAIQQHDALVMFSRYETFCLVIPECFACGKPAITSLAGGIADYMRPGLGVIVEPATEKELTKAFLTFTHSREEYKADEIRAFATRQFSKQVINTALNNIYQSALA